LRQHFRGNLIQHLHDELNRSIEQAVSDYFARSPETDPLDRMSVAFNFAFGFGRDLDVHVAGKTISVDFD